MDVHMYECRRVPWAVERKLSPYDECAIIFQSSISRQHNGIIVGDHDDVEHSPFSEGAVNNIFPGNALFGDGNLYVLEKYTW